MKERPDLVEKFGVEALPEIWLAVKDHGMLRISAGLKSASDIVESMMRGYEALTGESVFPQEYKYTRDLDQLDLEEPAGRKEEAPWF